MVVIIVKLSKKKNSPSKRGEKLITISPPMYTPFIRSSKENPFPKKLNKLCPRERQTRPRVNQNELFQAFQSHHRPLHTSLSLSLSPFLFALAYFLPHARPCTLVRTCARVCVSESLTLGARVAQCRVWTLWALCEARANEYARTMHQRVKTQWRTTQTPELRGQSA